MCPYGSSVPPAFSPSAGGWPVPSSRQTVVYSSEAMGKAGQKSSREKRKIAIQITKQNIQGRECQFWAYA